MWWLVALATVGGDPPIVLSGGGRIKQQEDKHKHWDPTQEHTHTGQPEHTGKRRTLTSVLSLYLGVGCCWLFRAADASLSCHLRSCQYDRSLQT